MEKLWLIKPGEVVRGLGNRAPEVEYGRVARTTIGPLTTAACRPLGAGLVLR